MRSRKSATPRQRPSMSTPWYTTSTPRSSAARVASAAASKPAPTLISQTSRPPARVGERGHRPLHRLGHLDRHRADVRADLLCRVGDVLAPALHGRKCRDLALDLVDRRSGRLRVRATAQALLLQ